MDFRSLLSTLTRALLVFFSKKTRRAASLEQVGVKTVLSCLKNDETRRFNDFPPAGRASSVVTAVVRKGVKHEW